MSDTKKFPAIGLLVVFGVGSAAAAVSLAGFGWLMVKQGLTQEAAAPLATAAICLGSFLSGLLMAILQKGKGLVWGAAEGVLFAGLLFILGTLYQSEWETMQFVRAGLVLLWGFWAGSSECCARSESGAECSVHATAAIHNKSRREKARCGSIRKRKQMQRRLCRRCRKIQRASLWQKKKP